MATAPKHLVICTDWNELGISFLVFKTRISKKGLSVKSVQVLKCSGVKVLMVTFFDHGLEHPTL